MSGRFLFYPEHIPSELKAGRVWVCCDEGKVPYMPLTTGRLRKASSTNPETWGFYEGAEAALATGRYWGIGRVITAHDPYVGVDLDGCRDPKTRRLTPWAWEIAERLSSYTEVSPSLTGIKIWIKAELAQSYKRAGLEIYRGGRYFTTTGKFLPQCPLTVNSRQAELEAIIAEEFPPRKKPKREPYDGPREPLDLRELLESFGVSVIAEKWDRTASLKYQVFCPWISEHTTAPETGTYIGQYENGALFFECHHAHCSERAWPEFREKVDPSPIRITRRGAGVYVRVSGVIRLG